MKANPVFALLLIFLALFLGRPALAASPSLELQIELDPSTRHLKAQALLTPSSRDFSFELHDSLAPISATAEGKDLPILSTRREGSVRTWRVVLPNGAEKFRMAYEGTLPALDRNLDHRGVLRNLPPMVSNQGSFLPAGGAWYPQPASLFTYRVSIAVPSDQRALVPGRMESEELPANDSTSRYRANFDFPHPTDGIDLMAGPWVIREKIMARPKGGSVRLRTYFFPELDAIPDLAEDYLKDTQRYLELYSQQIGAYPFTEFSVVASPLPTGFGMPTLTYLGADVVKLPFIRATSLGHEVLHNWWGNGVYVDYAKGNWCEGLTTFMADYAYKERESVEAAREMRLGWLRDFAAIPEGEHQPLSSFRSRTHGAAAAVGYGKSAMVFFMLRDTIGAEAFQRGIQAFWEKYRFKVATWNDLRTTFEQTSGLSLGSFFNQWINRAGGPVVKLAQAKATPASDKPHLTLTIKQSEPAYHLHLPVEISYPGRTEIRWLNLANSREVVELAVDERPDGVRVDSDLRVWRLLGPEQLPPILRQWIISPAPRIALASGGLEFAEIAKILAGRLFESPPRSIPLESINKGMEPALLIGLHADVDSALSSIGLPGRPANLAGRGSAQIWTIQRESGAPVAVVSARDANALQALMRPLPHYGGQSWLVFEGSRAIGKGVWPAQGRPFPVEASLQ